MRTRLALALGAGTLLLAGASAGPAAAAGPCDAPVRSAIACENSKPGTPQSTWDLAGASDPGIEGFATDISIDNGQTVGFKVNADSGYRIDIYRMGWYGGDGARLQASIGPLPAQAQPPCATEPTTLLVDCGNWSVSAAWPVPASAVSGVYIGALVRDGQSTPSSQMIFVVRDDASTSNLLVQTSDETWQAYNRYGGSSLYTGPPPVGRAYKVSYNRPFTTRDYAPEDFFFNAEYPMIRWLERNGYDATYTTGLDGERNGALIKRHKIFLSVGHDEYWSGGQRASVEAARDAGTTNLAFFSGNEVFWKTRWEPSIAGQPTPNRTLVTYKESLAAPGNDPTSIWTGLWRDPSGGQLPENALTGQLSMVNDGATTAIDVPASYGRLAFWRDTSIAAGQSATLPDGTLGYEWDEDLRDNGLEPPGTIQMSETMHPSAPVLQLDGSVVFGPATHHLTLYRAASGAQVFGAGTVQWSWGLDATHDHGGTPEDARMQQATTNLLADFGAGTVTKQPGLTPEPPAPGPPNALVKSTASPGSPGSTSDPTGAPRGGTAAAAGCVTISPNRHRVQVGRKTVLVVTVRRGSKRAKGVRVTLTAFGLRKTSHVTNAKGRVRFTVRPRRSGRLHLRAPATHSSCATPVSTISARKGHAKPARKSSAKQRASGLGTL